MAYKEQVYAEIIRRGVQLGYNVVAEFDWRVPAVVGIGPRVAHFDLVWMQKDVQRPVPLGENADLAALWGVKYVFEIEGCDVARARMDEHSQRNQYLNTLGIQLRVALYHQSAFRNPVAPHFIGRKINGVFVPYTEREINRHYMRQMDEYGDIVIDGRHIYEDGWWPAGL